MFADNGFLSSLKLYFNLMFSFYYFKKTICRGVGIGGKNLSALQNSQVLVIVYRRCFITLRKVLVFM